MSVRAEQIERRIAGFVRACRQAGMKVTHQRTEVFREVAGTDEHPDAETVFERVRRRIPALSLDTVYRTLATLERLGLIRRVDVVGDRARYDANTGPHHHFVCTVCGRIRDFTDESLDNLAPPKLLRAWGQIKSVQVQVRGICRQCKVKTKRRSR